MVVPAVVFQLEFEDEPEVKSDEKVADERPVSSGQAGKGSAIRHQAVGQSVSEVA